MPPSAPGAIRRHTAARRRPSAVLPGIDLEHVSGAIVLRFGTPSPGEWNSAFITAVAGLLSHCRADASAAAGNEGANGLIAVLGGGGAACSHRELPGIW